MPLPGRDGQLPADLETIIAWKPDLVVSLVETGELESLGLDSLPDHLRIVARHWLPLPIPDFSIPTDSATALAVVTHLAEALKAGGRVLVHCHGGKGRSGMIAARILTEFGLPAPEAVAAIRQSRPGAVETAEQEAWVASAG